MVTSESLSHLKECLAAALEALQAPAATADVADATSRVAEVLARVCQVPSGGGLDPRGIVEPLREALGSLQRPEVLSDPALSMGVPRVAEALRHASLVARQQPSESPPARGDHPQVSRAGVPTSTSAAPMVPAPDPNDEAPAGADFEVELGTHTPSNFYTTLTDPDVIRSGGLFVETYRALQPGQTLVLKVALPGGFSFVARAEVAWIRKAKFSNTAFGEPPGFGARLLQVSDEGRSLIARYTRNRQPLLYGEP